MKLFDVASYQNYSLDRVNQSIFFNDYEIKFEENQNQTITMNGYEEFSTNASVTCLVSNNLTFNYNATQCGEHNAFAQDSYMKLLNLTELEISLSTVYV